MFFPFRFTRCLGCTYVSVFGFLRRRCSAEIRVLPGVGSLRSRRAASEQEGLRRRPVHGLGGRRLGRGRFRSILSQYIRRKKSVPGNKLRAVKSILNTLEPFFLPLAVLEFLSQCSQSCGSGLQKRVVRCMNPIIQQASSGCDVLSQPTTIQNCNADECPPNSPGTKRRR